MSGEWWYRHGETRNINLVGAPVLRLSVLDVKVGQDEHGDEEEEHEEDRSKDGRADGKRRSAFSYGSQKIQRRSLVVTLRTTYVKPGGGANQLTSPDILGSVNDDDPDPSGSAPLESSPGLVLNLGPLFTGTGVRVVDPLPDDGGSVGHGDFKSESIGGQCHQSGEVAVDQGDSFLRVGTKAKDTRRVSRRARGSTSTH